MLALKGNQSSLHREMQALFESGLETNFAGLKHSVHSSNETGHGRTDERTCHVIEIPTDPPQRAAWTDLRTVAVTISRREIGGQETWESRLDISSHPRKPRFWRWRFVDTGRLKTVSTGSLMWSWAKTNAAHKTATVPRTSPPARQPAAARDHEQTRRQKQTPALRPRPELPAQSPTYRQVLMRWPWLRSNPAQLPD